MPISVFNTTASQVASATNVAFNVGTGSDRVLYVWTYWDNSNVTAATFNSVSMTQIGTSGNGRLWRLIAPGSGSLNLRFTVSDGGTTQFVAIALSGVDQTTPNGTLTSASGTSTSSNSGSVTVPTDGLALGFLRTGYLNNATAPAIASPSTLRGGHYSGSTGHGVAGGSRTTTGTVGWTHDNAAWAGIGVPVNAVVVPGVISGNVDLDAAVAEGEFGSSASDLAGGVTLAEAVAAGTLGLQPGTVTVSALKNWSGSLQTSVTIPVVTVLSMATGAQVLALTNQTTHATTADLAITSTSLVAGTTYMVAGWNADGSQRFAVPLTAA